jgi:hypothetical protein
MLRFLPFSTWRAFFVLGLVLLSAGTGHAATIMGQDANGAQIAINGTGHYTLVVYMNPDLEDESRKISIALDPYHARSNVQFIRVIDLRGGVPPAMRGIVRNHIRDEEAAEAARQKKAGISPSDLPSAIIPDFSGSPLDDLGWTKIYDHICFVIFNPQGKEVKRMSNVTSPSQVTAALNSVL